MKKRILSILLTLCMVAALLPGAALADVVDAGDSNAVASVTIVGGTTKYYNDWSDVADAIAPNTGDNGATVTATITLLDDVDISDGTCALHIGDNQNITLDLGGKQLSTGTSGKSGTYTIIIAKDPGNVPTNGSLKIVGPGTVDNKTSNATTIRNFGTLIIGEEGMTEHDSLIITRAVATPTVVGQQGRSAIKNEETATLTIYGGTINGDTRSIQNIGTLYIYGGTFTNTVDAWKYQNYESTMTINGGTFEAPVQIRSDNSWTGGGDVTITGGEFELSDDFSGQPIIAIDNTVPADYDGLSVLGGTFTGDSLIGGRDASQNGATIAVPSSIACIDDGFIYGGTFLGANGNPVTTLSYLAPGTELNATTGEVGREFGELVYTLDDSGLGVMYSVKGGVTGRYYTVQTVIENEDGTETPISLYSFEAPPQQSPAQFTFSVSSLNGGELLIWETDDALEFDDEGALLSPILAVAADDDEAP